MKYRLLVTDMDGTFLNSESLISEENLKAVKTARDNGLIFTVATGRPVQGVEKYNHLLELSGPVITYNGAVVTDIGTKEVLFERGLKREDAEKVIRLGQMYDERVGGGAPEVGCGSPDMGDSGTGCETPEATGRNASGTGYEIPGRNVTMCIWSDNKLYGSRLDERINDYKKLSGVEPALADYDSLLERGITKILWYAAPEMIDIILDEISEDEFSEVTVCRTQPMFLEFFNSNVSKAEAIKVIGDYYGVPREETVAIGDALNDLSMIEYAGLGVAVANALPEVKEKADYITVSNDEDGVAQVIFSLNLFKNSSAAGENT